MDITNIRDNEQILLNKAKIRLAQENPGMKLYNKNVILESLKKYTEGI